jgi:hypothetical protein
MIVDHVNTSLLVFLDLSIPIPNPYTTSFMLFTEVMNSLLTPSTFWEPRDVLDSIHPHDKFRNATSFPSIEETA